ncbi:hypothetical protein C5E11_05450 [Clavibacter michiganensis]|nr:hypothetical protein C5E11_05450 [Clavibacter michiganensis]
MKGESYESLRAALHVESASITHVAESFVHLFPVSGAAVSTLGDLLGNETLSSSSTLAKRIDELQFDLGEGPCWDALALARPVLEPDLRAAGGRVWPAFSVAVHDEVGAIFAFPMIVGHLHIGAIDMYTSEPTQLEAIQTRRATELAGLIARNVLRLALAETGDADGEHARPLARRLIHQATGMVLAQLNISAEDAALIIQGHAFAAGRPMADVADDILAGRIRFTLGANGIEHSS